MAFARYGAFWSNPKMERVAGDAFFFFLLVPWPATAHLCGYAHFQPKILTCLLNKCKNIPYKCFRSPVFIR